MPNPFVIGLGKLTQRLARLKGGGSAFPGLVIEKIDPDFAVDFLRRLPYGTVVVSGTNGKTTTTKIVTELLEAHGLRVGTYMSPHVERINERIRIDGEQADAGVGAGRGIGIKGRAFIAGTAAEHVAQLEKDHDCRNQKEDRAEVEKFHSVRQPFARAKNALRPAALLHIERIRPSFKSKRPYPI